MDHDAFVAALRHEGEALAAAASGRLTATIPAIEDWTVAEVVVHVGQGDRWVLNIARAGLDGHGALEALGADPDPADEEHLLDWYRSGNAELSGVLASLDPDLRGWTLQGRDQPLASWTRRRAQETAMHRWDIDSASGTPAPIAVPVAVDGIDELFEVFVPRLPAEMVAGEGETLHLHATDEGLEPGAGEWTVTFGPDGLTWEHGHAKGDAAVRASASDLLLLLWNRLPPTRVEVFGDLSVVDRWQGRIHL